MTKILVIEDDPQIRDNIQDILELESFDLILAENGSIGLQQAQSELPDLIICDIMMPEMNGFEVLAALRQVEQTADIPLIFLTAKADRTDFRQGMELGADDYLTKPFTPKELRQAIVTRLQKKAQIETKYTTQVQQISQQLNLQLYHDQTTNLPNRLALRKKFNSLWQHYQSEVEKNYIISILCLSLDRFSQMQSYLGYEKSDLLLKQVAQRLKALLQTQGEIIYLGAADFAILLFPLSSKQLVFNTIKKLQTQLGQLYQIKGQEVFISTSIGISFAPQDGTEIEKLLTNGKKALHKAQQNVSDHYEVYRGIFEIGIARQLSLENDLHCAIERNQFELYYQPIISLKTRKIIGCEALLRWNHPVRSTIPPSIFIPIAEELGLINDIGNWVFRQACRQLKKWQEKGFINHKLSVNLSALQFHQPDFRQNLISALVEYSVNPKQIELELTETQVIKDIEIAKKQLKSLKVLDFKIAIDDFGTGYSSLQYLQQLPFDTLKIDRVFIQNLDNNQSNAAIAEAIIKIAHSLNIQVVAEGVETPEELKFLEQHQCDLIQGYLFSRPLPLAGFETLLHSCQHLP